MTFPKLLRYWDSLAESSHQNEQFCQKWVEETLPPISVALTGQVRKDSLS
ncbi:hypothetical protein [Sodalinema gerasimenkoae]|nr:hypothetical protein [Sodalinema gerasimenkoae]